MILVCVLICLVLASSLITSTLHTALQNRHQLHMLRQQVQADLLLEAGILRAGDKLRQRPDYEGEQWRLQPGALADDSSAVVEIKVAPAENDTRTVQIIVRLPADTLNCVQRSYTYSLPSLSPSHEE